MSLSTYDDILLSHLFAHGFRQDISSCKDTAAKKNHYVHLPDAVSLHQSLWRKKRHITLPKIL